MKFFTFTFLVLVTSISLTSQVINEIQPNPPGSDPSSQSLEISGNPGASFSGFLLSIEDDGDDGRVDRQSSISGTFDINGLISTTISDLENPSFTLILCELGPGIGSDIDDDNDGNVNADLSALGTIYDAIGVADDNSENLYASQLGGSDFSYTGAEPELMFRDGVDGNWFAVNSLSGATTTYDINAVSQDGSVFDKDPRITTFGEVNPTATTVPVTYSSISVENQNNSNLITWSTSSEQNNDYFDVEHSLNGKDFSSIGRVGAKGNSRATGAYEFIHDGPIQGMHYYRLKQVDLDGVYSYSEVRSIDVIKEGKVSIYPSMVQGEMTIRHNFIHPTQVKVYNMSGQEVVSFSKVNSETTLDVTALKPNIYFVQVVSGSQQVTKRIIKQ